MLVAALVGPLLAVPNFSAKAQTTPGYDIVATVPVGAEGVQYSPKRNEELQWGPSALAVAPDGTFVIANPVNNTLLRTGAAGQRLPTITLPQPFAASQTSKQHRPGFSR